MYNFTKQNYIEVKRGVEDVNDQSEVAILTAFLKKESERSKNEEIEKSKKLTKNIKKVVPILNS